jgi:CHAD domain-containing protein
MSLVHRYRLAADAEVDAFVSGLGNRTTLEPDTVEVVERTVHDTFDWRLYNGGSLIERRRVVDEPNATVLWRSFARGDTLALLERDDVPRFASELPSGPIADRLGAVVEMRALLPLVSVTTRRTTLRLLDDERKTIARLVAEEVVDTDGTEGHLGPGPGLEAVLAVVPLRGYADESSGLTDLLDAQVLLTPGADDLMVAALRAAGHDPGGYTSKLRTRLDPRQTAQQAWLTMLRTLFAAMRTNESGTRADLDSEFLHDYRVAVRRTRSVLGEAHDIFPADRLATFRDAFKWLGGATSPTRDLDVFLLDTADFRDELPAERRDDLAAFTGFLEGRQHIAHDTLVRDLDTDRYADLVDEWSRFLDSPPAPGRDETDADRPAPEVAAERIARAHRRMIKHGRRIDAGSEPERLHDLRKDAKRLRYLLECFGSLFPADEITPIVKQLKGVQEVLGTYQDCQVQSGQLEQFAQDLLDQGQVGAAGVMVIGLLVEQLDHRAIAARTEFAARFHEFDTKPVRRAVHDLLPHHPETEASAPASATSASIDPTTDTDPSQEPAP